MGRDYREVLRQRGIMPRIESRRLLTQVKESWHRLPADRRWEFISWAGLIEPLRVDDSHDCKERPHS